MTSSGDEPFGDMPESNLTSFLGTRDGGRSFVDTILIDRCIHVARHVGLGSVYFGVESGKVDGNFSRPGDAA